MQTLIRLYAGLKCENKDLDCFHKTVFHILLPEQTKIAEVLERIGINRHGVQITLVNGLSRPLEYTLCDGDELAVFPPVGGG